MKLGEVPFGGPIEPPKSWLPDRNTLVYIEQTPDCPRCNASMHWLQSSWQCPSCRYKEGCCG